MKERYGGFSIVAVPSIWVFGSISVFFYSFVQRIPKEYRPFFDVEALSGLAVLLLLLPPFAAFVSRAVYTFSVVIVRDINRRARRNSNASINTFTRSWLIRIRRFLSRYEHMLQSLFFFLVFAKFFLDGVLILFFLLTILSVSFAVVSANYYYEFSKHVMTNAHEVVEEPFFPRGVSYDRKLNFLLRSAALVVPAIAVVLGLFLGWDRLAREVCVATESASIIGAVYSKTADGVILVSLDQGMANWVRTLPASNVEFVPFSSIRGVSASMNC